MTFVLLMFRFLEFKFRGSFLSGGTEDSLPSQRNISLKIICIPWWHMPVNHKERKKLTLQICMHVLFLVLDII